MLMMRAVALCCLSLVWMSTVQAVQPEPQKVWVQDTQAIMGTRIHVELQAADQAQGKLWTDLVMTEMHRIDHVFSPYKESSELSRLNRLAGQRWVAVSDEMMAMLERAARVSAMTEGAFDITYASIGRYYDYRQGKAPDSKLVRDKLAAIDYRHVELDRQSKRVRYQNAHVYVDLGGIAKGYAVDRAITLLKEAGVTQASVAAGGDSRIIGDRDGQPWNVGVKHPRRDDRMSVLLPLVDTAVSTSGDYERYFETDGVRYHHILDPATGRSAADAWSVTILGPEAMLTDGLSTSVFVLGPERGLALINRLPGIDAIIIDRHGKLLYSDDLAGL